MRFTLIAVLVMAFSAVFVPHAMAQQYYAATLDGGQVVSPSGSPATGVGCFALNTDNTLDYLVSYAGLVGDETGAHIHGPAPAGVNAGVVFGFALGTPKAGTFGPLTAQQVSDLGDGLYYVQIHSTSFPGGEIRGQIVPSGTPCAVPTEPSTWGAVKAFYR